MTYFRLLLHTKGLFQQSNNVKHAKGMLIIKLRQKNRGTRALKEASGLWVLSPYRKKLLLHFPQHSFQHWETALGLKIKYCMCNQGCAKWGPIVFYGIYSLERGPIHTKKKEKRGNLVKTNSEIILLGLRSLIKFVSGSIFEIK